MEGSVIDQDILNSLRETTGADFLNELLETFFEDSSTQINTMREALAEDDAETFRRAAHSLKSNSSSFGAMGLSALARELEFLGKDGNLACVGSKLDQLADEYHKVQEVLQGSKDGS
jgi:HPt (histidine-containing phosphotransfer) domain-containing protein